MSLDWISRFRAPDLADDLRVAIGVNADDGLLRVEGRGGVIYWDIELNMSERMEFVATAIHHGWPYLMGDR